MNLNKDVWSAINWKGDVVSSKKDNTPSASDFKDYFGSLLLTEEDENMENIDVTSSPYTPLR